MRYSINALWVAVNEYQIVGPTKSQQDGSSDDCVAPTVDPTIVDPGETDSALVLSSFNGVEA
jgi:hypothetical protein